MSSPTTDRFRVALLSERQRVVGAIENLHLDGHESELGESDAHGDENASVTLDRELDHTLEENSENVLAAIDAALVLIENGTFGTCQGCGGAIAVARLEAIPYATHCIDCKRRAERG